MSDQFTKTFEKLWIGFRARWCDSHELGGATAFSHEELKVPMLHRVVQIDVPGAMVDTMIDSALDHFRERDFDCAFTLSPLDRPADLAERLKRRGFAFELQAVAMLCDRDVRPLCSESVEVEELDPSRYGVWADIMCRSFDFPDGVGALGRKVLDIPEVRFYLAYVDREPAGTALLYTRFGLGCVDFIGTLPHYRRRGVASAITARAVADSQAMGNRWTGLEVVAGSAAERVYKRVGFRPVHNRPRYVRSTSRIDRDPAPRTA
ncbi:MAG: GNAT family N-acetyltransferase [Gemmatimonadetes bacterium]|nr:GNAT family N-acetyltransferase [Gemmatimonadota bacterium]MDE3258107.1 GNAT family N-acetyltransferase [Gemmatimonadota bacterium]